MATSTNCAPTLPSVDPTAIESLNQLHEGESFTGSLRVFSVAELVQIIHSAEETGILNLQCDQTGQRGKMFFRNGRLSDADFRNLEPEEAVYAMLDMEKGGFSFLRSNRIPQYQKIQKETISLLISASHRRDELERQTSG